MLIAAELNAANSRCAAIIRSHFDDPKRQNEECDIEVHTRLEKIFEYHNDTISESTIQTKWIKGLWNAQRGRKAERSSHFLNVNVGEKGPPFKILRLEANIGNKEGDNCVLSEQDIYDTKEMTATVTVAPKSQLIRWQLVSHILGHDIGYDHIIDKSDKEGDKDGDKFALDWSKCVARILVPRQIFYNQTRLRIKHKAQGKFLTIVTHKNWPAATLGLNSQFYFVLHKTPQGIRIKAANTTVPDYDVLYSSDSGAIYFDRWTTDSSKQCWTISKADPLFNGDTVSFMNKWWDDSALCFHNGSVACTRNKEDEWILII